MPSPNSMLFIIKDGKKDEVIKFFNCPYFMESYSVEFIPSDLKKNKYSFELTYDNLKKYIQNLLDLLRYDSEPYDEIQLTTKMIPSIMFCIADLDRPHIRNLIEHNIITALNTNIEFQSQ